MATVLTDHGRVACHGIKIPFGGVCKDSEGPVICCLQFCLVWSAPADHLQVACQAGTIKLNLQETE